MLQAQQRPRETAHRQRERSTSPREARSTTLRGERNIPFHSRVDRHGNTYGDRAATRQTRNPPPVERITGTEVVSRAAAADWRADHTTREREALSPPYVKQRESRGIRRAPLRTSVSHHQVQQWRAKPQLTFEQALPDSGPSGEQENHSNKGNQRSIPTEDQVLLELQETTRQYLNVADPTERAARAQRVIQGEAQGDVEATVASIIEAASYRVQEERPNDLIPTSYLPSNRTQEKAPVQNNRLFATESSREDIQEATRRYLNHADPTEAAARRQRVLQGDAHNFLQERADETIVVPPQLGSSFPTGTRL